MTFELIDVPGLVARGARAAHAITARDEQSFEEWLFDLEGKGGWDGIEAFSSLSAHALAVEGLTVQEGIAIRMMQAAVFGLVLCMSQALVKTTAGESLI